MDEYIDCLLRHDSVFGIALPRLAKQFHLEEAGYLDGPRIPRGIFYEDSDNDKAKAFNAEQHLLELATVHGVVEAQHALETATKTSKTSATKTRVSSYHYC